MWRANPFTYSLFQNTLQQSLYFFSTFIKIIIPILSGEIDQHRFERGPSSLLTKPDQQNQTGTAPPPQAEIGGTKTQAETKIVEHSHPRLRLAQTQAQAETHATAPPGRDPRRCPSRPRPTLSPFHYETRSTHQPIGWI